MLDIIIVVLQGVTILVSVIALVVNIRSTTKENKKQRMVEITIKQRLADMENTKKAYTIFLTYLNPTVINEMKGNGYFEKLWMSYNELASLLKINYSQDMELLQHMKKACALAEYYAKNSDKKTEKELIDSAKLIYELFSVYTYSNWCCIKEQAYGTELKSIDYKKIYDKYYNEFVGRV